MKKRIMATQDAIDLIESLKSQHGTLMFHQSGGCCDGSAPMCFKSGEFMVGYSDVGLGYVSDCAFWMSKDQFEYWRHTLLVLDVVEGRGSSFSLEIPSGKRFIIRSVLFESEDMNDLEPLFYKVDS